MIEFRVIFISNLGSPQRLLLLLLLLLLLIIIIIVVIIILLLIPALMVLHWSLSESKSPPVTRTLLSILADLNNAVVWMISDCPLIFNSSSPLTKPLGNVTSALIIIGITVTFMFHCFFLVFGKFQVLVSLSFRLIFTQWPAGTDKSAIWLFFFFFFFFFC